MPVGNVAGSAIVGTALDAPVRLVVTGPDSLPVAGATVSWVASNGGSVSEPETQTDARGIASVRWTLGTVAGLQNLTAHVVGLAPVIFGANAVPDRAASVRLGTDFLVVPLLGDTVRLSSGVFDQYGNAVPIGTTFTLESGGGVLTALGGSSFVARTRGLATIRATADTASTRLTVLVDPAPPQISSVSPDTIVPGSSIVVHGIGFALLPEVIELNIAGLRANVRAVSATRIEADVPLVYPCLPAGPQPVRVTVAAFTDERPATFRSATPLRLQPGQSVNINTDAARCTEVLPPADHSRAKYVVSVINTSVTAAATSGFELRGTGVGALAGRAATPVITGPPVAFASAASATMRQGSGQSTRGQSGMRQPTRLAASAMAQLEDDTRALGRHATHLEAQRTLAARAGSPLSAWRTRAAAQRGVAAVSAPVSLGDTLTLKALFNSCSVGQTVRARVAYVGSRALVLEDIAAPRAGSMDEQYRLIGEEFDQVQYPLLNNQIGDPLAMNAAMGGDGRVTMLFTPYVNDSLPGITGYVTACNFYPKQTFAASNEDEVFYARVASLAESPDDWRRSIRSTVVHESKHLAAFALRFLDGTPFEESWLEESLARVAEELYSRTFANGGAWKANVGFASTIQCELAQCDGRPLIMWKHFSVLHQYLRGIDTLTPIGAAANGDFTFYASGWSLVRWAADQYATNESQWLKSLVRGGQLSGLSNLSQHTGRPAGEMLADWALTHALEMLPGVIPARPQLSFPSWDTQSMFSGLSATFPGAFVARPLNARAMTFGQFTLPVAKLRAFSSSYFSFEGDQTGSQLLELRGEGGATFPPSSLRLAVVRVE